MAMKARKPPYSAVTDLDVRLYVLLLDKCKTGLDANPTEGRL